MMAMYIPFALTIFFNVHSGFFIVMATVLVLSLFELYRLFNIPLKYITFTIFLYLTMYIYMYFIMQKSRAMFALPLLLVISTSTAIYILTAFIDKIVYSYDSRLFYKMSFLYVLSIFYIFLPVLINLFFSLSITGLNVFLYQVAVCKIADTAALIIGRKYGKLKLAPFISPNKTIEGFAGSLVAGLVFCSIFYFISPPFKKTNFFLLHIFVGLVMIILNNFGDLFESFLKRINNVKDSSSLLGGIGGILDLIDGILPSTYIMFLYYNFIIG